MEVVWDILGVLLALGCLYLMYRLVRPLFEKKEPKEFKGPGKPGDGGQPNPKL